MKKRYVYKTKFVIQNHERKFLVVSSTQGVELLSETDVNNKNNLADKLLVFDTPQDAEEFIWYHEYLEIDPTLRVVSY